ncbi:MAG: cyclohexanecarboxylate-CoA ligase [Xanthobacteraceae bacterium]|nr:MAG: cyclohexanecarboxylate-CoA ligase [Xanthobacteraceae bacterium]
MSFATHLTDERIADMTGSGQWRGRTLLDYLADAAHRHPDKVAVTGPDGHGRTVRLSYLELDELSRHVAAGLIRLGVGKGDVVSMQLPNWVEFFLIHLGCLRLGAVTNPLMPFLRHRELTFMLGLAESKVVIVPREFRGFDYPAMIAELRADLPKLAHCIVVGGEGPASFDAALLNAPEAPLPADALSPNDVIEILYTSGTTGEPKGVMQISNTLFSALPDMCDRLRLASDDVVLMSSPLAHQTGFIYGMMISIMLGAKCVLQDIWNAEIAARLIAAEGVTFTMASTPFLADLTEEAGRGRADLTTLRIFLAAGAPLPRALVHTASEKLGAHILSGWGMTETELVTVTSPDDAEDLVVNTDGRAFKTMAVRVVDEQGRELPADTEGRLQVRGAGNFVGYLKRPELYSMDAEGWFDTGDLARMDAAGYIRITGRSKDIIIRGGENIPVAEIENILFAHPAVREIAIVGVPDPRLGERACAFVTLKEGQSLSFDDMVNHLNSRRIAKSYLPERLEVVTELPRTASGKIQKFILRDLARCLPDTP